MRSAKKRSTWLSPDELVAVRCTCQRDLFGEPSADHCGPVRDVIVRDEIDVEFARYGSLDLVKNLAKFGGAMAPAALANDPSGRNIEAGEQLCGAMAFVRHGIFGPPGRDTSEASAGFGPAPGFGTSHPHTERWRAPAVRRRDPRHRALWPRSSDRSRA